MLSSGFLLSLCSSATGSPPQQPLDLDDRPILSYPRITSASQRVLAGNRAAGQASGDGAIDLGNRGMRSRGRPRSPRAPDCNGNSPSVGYSGVGADGVPRIIRVDEQTGAVRMEPCSCYKPLAEAARRLRRRSRQPRGIDALMAAVLTPP